MKTILLILSLGMIALGVRAQTFPQPPSQQDILRRIQARRAAMTNHVGSAMFPSSQMGQAGQAGQPPTFPTPGGLGAPAGTAPTMAAAAAAAGNGGAVDGSGGGAPEEMIAPGTINFQGVDVNQVLEVYAQLVGRTLLRGALPQASIVLKTETPLTKTETIEALKAVLALNNIVVIDVGDKFVKVMAAEGASTAAAAVDNSSTTNLPELGSYVTHIVQLKYVKPSEMLPIIQPFAKLQNSILPIDSNGILVLRDYAENVKRMLEMIDRIDVSVPAEYISEVIPIRYAQAEDIANALNSLGGSGGSTVSFGSSGGGSTVNGFHGVGSAGGFGGGGIGGGGTISGLGSSGAYASQGGYGSQGGIGQGRTTGLNGTPSSGGTFQSRLNSILNKAGGGGQQDAIQVFGQAKIIADSRSNSLLIFATRSDMEHIKKVIGDLDVLLAQVLIEAIIMDVSLSKGWNFGVSAAQNPKTFSSSTPVIGGGGFNNGQPFANFLSGLSNANYFAQGSNVTSSLGSGFSYFGNIGPTWDLAVQALAQDSSASVIQRPRIQTSQAKTATFFDGETVPYITSSYSGGVGYGANSSYSQLSVGVELDVTPFINPDGLVVMDINQEIDDIVSATSANGDLAPTTSKRTLNSEIAVRDKDTIILGGFIRSDTSKTRSGVPVLQDIPLLGNLFTQRTSSKDRQELLVLMRPTVLRTPDKAAEQTLVEEKRLPGVSGAATEDAAYERQLIEAQRKAEKRHANSTGHYDGFYNENSTPSTSPSPQALPAAQDAAPMPQPMNSLNSGANTNGY
jgi:general secretion pathway protein D